MSEATRDRPDEGPENDDGRASPDEVCERVGTEDMEHRAGDEPDEDDEYDRELSRESTVDRGMARWQLGSAKVGVRSHDRTMPRVRRIGIRATADHARVRTTDCRLTPKRHLRTLARQRPLCWCFSRAPTRRQLRDLRHER